MNKTLFFDLGNVIIFFSHEKMVLQIAELCQIDKKQIHELLFGQGWGNLYEYGHVSSRDLHTKMCELSQREVDFKALMHACSDIFRSNESLVPLLQKLKNSGAQLILLSNTCEPHFERAYAQFPQLKLFDDFVLSYKVRARKPDKEIFQYALSRAKAPVERCFYTDDIEEYISAAKKEGLDGETFKDALSLEKQLQARGFLLS